VVIGCGAGVDQAGLRCALIDSVTQIGLQSSDH
jgi:hypothetical protein